MLPIASSWPSAPKVTLGEFWLRADEVTSVQFPSEPSGTLQNQFTGMDDALLPVKGVDFVTW